MINYEIIGVGIDSININRFESWNKFSKKKLLKIFSNEEIEYCLDCPEKSIERFAARFAAKEAAFKALSVDIPFLKFCKLVHILKVKNKPILIVDWAKLNIPENLKTFISITHTNSIATVIVIFQKKN